MRILHVLMGLAMVVPTFAGDSDVEWRRLGSVPKLRTVKVYLKNGREMKGAIQQVEPERLQLALGIKSVTVRTKNLPRRVEAQVGQTVALNDRSGRSIEGTLRAVHEDDVSIDQATSTLWVPRAEIQRITWRSAGMGALVGLGIGAGGGVVWGAAAPPVHDSGASRAGNVVGCTVILGGLGAAVGAGIGAERTLYAEPVQPPKPRADMRRAR